jgi:hypothetical protein
MRAGSGSKILLLVGLGCAGLAAAAQGPAPQREITVIVIDKLPQPQPVRAVRVSLEYLDSGVKITEAQQVTNSQGEALLPVSAEVAQRANLRIEISGASGLAIYHPADGQILTGFAPSVKAITIELLPAGSPGLLDPAQIQAYVRRLQLRVNSLQKQVAALRTEAVEGQQYYAATTLSDLAQTTGFSPDQLRKQVEDWARSVQSQSAQATPEERALAKFALERIPNLDTLKDEIRQYHDCTCTCGCYAHDLDEQADRAIAFLRQRAAHRRPNEKLALILGLDETALSNYQEMSSDDFGYIASTFNAWIESSRAPAILATLRLYREAQQLGVSIFFITGRPESERGATERNLRAQGFDNWQGLVMRSIEHAQTYGKFKATVRAQIAAQGYTLAVNVGSQWSELEGEPAAEFSVKYPDPFYRIP